MSTQTPWQEIQLQLDLVAQEHDQQQGFTPRLIACRARMLNQLLAPGVVLDLGCADGLLTAYLAAHHHRVIAVDGSPVRIQRTRERTAGLVNVTVVQSLFEHFIPWPELKLDAVILACVLEHVPQPVELLRRCAGWLAPGGKLVAVVPHAESLHRRAGVLMGLLGHLCEPDESDRRLGHHWCYTRKLLAEHFEQAGLQVVQSGGYLLKPLPNRQMASLTPQLVDAYFELGQQFPDLAAEIYAVGQAG